MDKANEVTDLTVMQVNPDEPEAMKAFMGLIEEHYRESWPEEVARPRWRDRYLKFLEDRFRTDIRRWCWLVYTDEAICGVATFYLSGPVDDYLGVIQELYVRPEYRGRHIGSELFANVRRELQGAGALRIKASVAVDEPGRMKFFEAYGFHFERIHMVLDLERKDDTNGSIL